MDILGELHVGRAVKQQRHFQTNPVLRGIGEVRGDRLELNDVVGFGRDVRQAGLAFLLLPRQRPWLPWPVPPVRRP